MTRNLLRNRIPALFALTFTLALGAYAQKAPKLPGDLPAYGPLKPYAGPKVISSKLSNGLTVWLVPRPGYPKVAFALAVHGGLASDPKDLPGLSDVLASTVTLGTKSRTAKQLTEEIAAAGGALNSRADSDSVVVSTDVPSWKMQVALRLLADIAQNATFPEDQVALTKKNSAEELRGQEARSIDRKSTRLNSS